MTRRVLLASAFCSGLLPAQKADIGYADLSLVDDLEVPNELFFVREHFPAPADLTAAWKLAVGEKEYSLDEIAGRPAKVLPATLECAENGVGGGLVSHAVWTGIPLASLLPANPTAKTVRLVSADGYSRSLPIGKALHPDTMIAYSMNGEKLPVNHGFPLRAIVPGWYGMDSVKWLRRVELVEAEEAPRDYLRQTKGFFGVRTGDAVTAIQVKSVFTRPQEGAVFTKRRFTVRGMAWAGENRITQVEFSSDGGATWAPATLAAATPYTWTPWSFDWKIPRAGTYSLSVRAKDDKGREQPRERAADRADAYENNGWQTVGVTAI